MISDTLELCDLVDMPGISDPNMPMDTWDGAVRGSDHVIWCTHATQAWRQSEAAMWDRMRPATAGANLLLVTQFDKLRNPRDRARVLARVASETAGKFAATYPVSLLDALEAGDDLDAWKDSGAHDFMERLVEILLDPPAAPVAATAAGRAACCRSCGRRDCPRERHRDPAPARQPDHPAAGPGQGEGARRAATTAPCDHGRLAWRYGARSAVT